MKEDLADQYLGKHLLIGLTYVDHQGDLIEQTQLHGHIIRVDEQGCIVVELHGSGEEFTLPPGLSNLQEAPKGDYRLRSTGEVVVDPDLLTSWTIHRPKPEKD